MVHVMQSCSFSFIFSFFRRGQGLGGKKGGGGGESLGFSHWKDSMVVIEIQLLKPQVLLEDGLFLDQSDVV